MFYITNNIFNIIKHKSIKFYDRFKVTFQELLLYQRILDEA